ncbi:F-box only protein 27 isoform X3 [Marmota monax]|uniref:F-box only protein 27 isoform X3 n=1 Tax=Marmota monax TaxID=9995 RepID=UPI0026F310EB|nr:F-box only protein 27 isoform X3 [Marmota monax]
MAGSSAAGSGWGTMGASASRGQATRVPGPKLDPEEALDLSQLPPELLLVVLSHVPPRTLLTRCRRVCREWRALVDGQALWLLILARDHSAAGRALMSFVRNCLPPACDARPCPLGRFCVRRPLGRNLICNPCGQVGAARSRSWTWRRRVCGQNCWTVAGLRSVSLTDTDQTVLDTFSAVPDPIEQWNNNICFQVTHVFSNIKTGVRFVSFEHWGQDTQFWAGHYGARVTNSSVIIRVSQS